MLKVRLSHNDQIQAVYVPVNFGVDSTGKEIKKPISFDGSIHELSNAQIQKICFNLVNRGVPGGGIPQVRPGYNMSKICKMEVEGEEGFEEFDIERFAAEGALPPVEEPVEIEKAPVEPVAPVEPIAPAETESNVESEAPVETPEAPEE